MEKYKSEEMLSSWFGEGLSYALLPEVDLWKVQQG